jgi:transmembrane sensor
MGDNSRFAFLLNRYFAGLADEEENEELASLVRKGSHDAELKAMIEKYLETDAGAHDVSSREAREILDNILMDSPEMEPAQETYQKTNKTKVISISPWKRSFRYTAAAVLIIGIGVTGWWGASNFINKISDTSASDLAQQDQSKNKSLLKGVEASVFIGKQFIRLPDGSTVLLNAGSELSYGQNFGTGTREVSLKGEGFFDIAHDASKPFLVKANGITTTVLGTAFNIRAYPTDKQVKITVKRGKVKVGDDSKTFGTITPDQQIAVATETHDFIQTDLGSDTAERETAWMNSSLILDDVNMETAAALIAERYNTKVIFAKKEMKACRIRAEFLNGESLEQVLQVVSAVVQATYVIQADGNVKLDGKGCE